MGFIAYQLLDNRAVRIFLECQDEDGGAVSYTQAIDVEFPEGAAGCRLAGVDGILALKKFYKLVFSLEERARERGGDWRKVFDSVPDVVAHLDLTKNVRRLGAQAAVSQKAGLQKRFK